MIYIPPDTATLENIGQSQIRLLIQGYYGTGKTFSAMTAPNPCVLNFDNNLGAHAGRKDIIDVKFYCDSFVRKYNPSGIKYLAYFSWLKSEGKKLSKEQTLVEDGLTNLSNHYDREAPVPFSSKTGKPDYQEWWGNKLDWNKEMFEEIKSLPCNFIMTCHEAPERDADGVVTGKVLPLLQGSFKDQLGTHFTDIFRQHALTKLSRQEAENQKEKLLINFGMKSIDEFMAFQDTFKYTTMYLWQTCPDSIANCKSHLSGLPKFIKADWSIFK